MKAYKTILFITAVFAMMGLIGISIPEDGVQLGKSNFTFPSPREIMEGKIERSIPTLVNLQEVFYSSAKIKQEIEENIKREQEKKQANQYAKKHRKVVTNRTTPSFPNNDVKWIYPLFEALEGAKDKKVRIIHYGDSQIEEDRMSSYLRAALQEKFGGYGVGLLPAIQSIPSISIGQKCNKSLNRYLVYGTSRMRMDGRNYGPLGQTAQLTDEATFTFQRRNYNKTRENTKYFNKVTILLDEIEKEVTASINVEGYSATKNSAEEGTMITFDLPDSISEASITLKGKALVHGFMMDGTDTGVQFDNVAMRGCSGTVFTSINTNSLEDYYSKNTVSLIILQFGGNSVPYTKSNAAIISYCEQLLRQIEYFREISPESLILFIGPSDMSTNQNGRMETYEHLPKLVNTLRNMCVTNGVAYWDLYKAMGGKNSMVEWVKMNPPLAGSDYIHFTHRGADYASQMLWEGLMEVYELYKMSTNNGEEPTAN